MLLRQSASVWGSEQYFSREPGLSLLISLHSTTPFFSEDFKNCSGSQTVFLGESKTPKDISHVTIRSSGFITEDRTAPWGSCKD